MILERQEKLDILAVYTGLKCVCGADKPPLYWTCMPCRATLVDTPDWVEVTKLCSAHLGLVRKMLAGLRPA